MNIGAKLAAVPRVYLIWLAVAVVGYTLCQRSILLSDEGYILYQANELAHGRVMYRDLDSFVAPGIWLLLAGVFRAFGASVFISRMVSFTCYLATALVLFRIVRLVANERYAYLTVVAYAALSVWAFPAWHFAFYSAWSILAALLALERLLTWQRDANYRALFASGLFIGVSASFKQNYGALAGIAVGTTVVIEILSASASRRAFVSLLAQRSLLVLSGALTAVLPVAAYFWFNDALADAFHSLVVRPFSEFASQHTLPFPPLDAAIRSDFFVGKARLSYEAAPVSNTPYPHIVPLTVQRLVQVMHVVLYWAPFVLFATASLLLLRKHPDSTRAKMGLLACLTMSGFVFLGVFPRADFNHLINVYQPLLVLTAVVAYSIERSLATSAARFRALTLLACVPFAVVALFWYALIVRSMAVPLSMPRGGVMIDFFEASMISEEVQKMRELTTPDEPILAMPGLAMLNFLAERRIPGPYANFFAVHISHDQGRGVVRALETEQVRWAIVEHFDYFADTLKMREFAPELMAYLRRNFRQAFGVAIDRHWFLERREKPLDQVHRVSVLSDCNVETRDFSERAIRMRLLYDGLYHRFRGPGVSNADLLKTRCTVTVPPDATLAFQLGYRQPNRASKNAAIAASVSIVPVDDSGRPERIFSKTLHVTPVTTWFSPAPEEYRVSLAEHAGDKVRLVFRTAFRGDAAPSFLDLEGFAVTWNDINIETPLAKNPVPASR